MADAMADLAASEGRQRGTDVLTRCLLDSLLEAAHVWPRIRLVTIGQANRGGGWRDPAVPARGTDDDGPQLLVDVPAAEAAPIVAAQIAYGGRLGLVRGPAGGGKSTAIANAVARVTTGRPWLGLPVQPGAVVLCTEDPYTWRAVVTAAGGDLQRVHLRRWRNLPAAIAALTPVLAIVDTLQYVAHDIGSGELDSAREVDLILRPLEALCRDYGTAIVVTVYEPWAEAGGGLVDKASGTKKRPRHSGAKVATADYVMRCSTVDSVTTIERGPKVRRGIEVAAVSRIDIHGEPVAAAVAEPPPPTIIEPGNGRQIVIPDAAQWLIPHLQPGEALTHVDLEARAGCKAARVRAARKLLIAAGIWTGTGTGKRGDPTRVEVAIPIPVPISKPTPPDRGTGIPRDARPACVHAGGRESGRASGLPSQPVAARGRSLFAEPRCSGNLAMSD